MTNKALLTPAVPDPLHSRVRDRVLSPFCPMGSKLKSLSFEQSLTPVHELGRCEKASCSANTLIAGVEISRSVFPAIPCHGGDGVSGTRHRFEQPTCLWLCHHQGHRHGATSTTQVVVGLHSVCRGTGSRSEGWSSPLQPTSHINPAEEMFNQPPGPPCSRR